MRHKQLEIPTREEMTERNYPEDAIGYILSLEVLASEYKENYQVEVDKNVELTEQIRTLNDDMLVKGIEVEAAERKAESALAKSAQNHRRNIWYQRRYGQQPDRTTVNMNVLQKFVTKLFRI